MLPHMLNLMSVGHTARA